MGGLFGSKTTTQKSGNYAYDDLKGYTQPYIQNGMDANGIAQGLISGKTDPMEFLLRSPGYQAAMDSGIRAVNGNQVGKGLLRSGSTLRGQTQFGQQLGTQTYNQILDNLFKQATLGVTSQGVLSDAGKYSTMTEKSSPGIGGLLGGLLLTAATGGIGGLGMLGSLGGGLAGTAANAGGLIASDRRVKEDIRRVGEHEGLGVYEWKYKFMDGRFRGVMADEVALLRPDALGPIIHGFATVNYDKLGMKMEVVNAN